MKILILCGVFHSVNQEEVVENAVKSVEFSANRFQQKLIEGFWEQYPQTEVISAPFVGSYPDASKMRRFTGFKACQQEYTYVAFNNLWGYRNYSRAKALKKAIVGFIADKDPEKRIIIYSAHTPFLEAAVYAKRRDPRIKICFYVPDLPNYMNLSANRSRIYDFAKRFDIARMRKYMCEVDCFVLLTEHMKNVLPVGDKPYRVIEGIMSGKEFGKEAQPAAIDDKEKYIVYTGKLEQAFGVRTLIDGFMHMQDANCRLVLCGRGDSTDYAMEAAKRDARILVMGQVTPEVATQWQQRAAVLVNPRMNNNEYTKYSFPSKNIEYLLSGKPVVAYMLSGMPLEYRAFIYEAQEEQPLAHALQAALEQAMNVSLEDQRRKHQSFVEYAKKKLDNTMIARQIMHMME